MIAIPMVTVVYVLVNISYYTVMSLNDVINSPAVAVVCTTHTNTHTNTSTYLNRIRFLSNLAKLDIISGELTH